MSKIRYWVDENKEIGSAVEKKQHEDLIQPVEVCSYKDAKFVDGPPVLVGMLVEIEDDQTQTTRDGMSNSPENG